MLLPSTAHELNSEASLARLINFPSSLFEIYTMILVTGGTGLIGSRLLFDLATSGKTVRALKRGSGSTGLTDRLFRGQESLLRRVEWVEGDVTDIFSLEAAMKDVTEIYHCAALVSFQSSDARRMMKVNSEGTANMVNLSLEKGIKRFCHVSSTAALGRSEEGALIDEKTSWRHSPFNSAYAISKHSAEREVWRSIEEGLPAFIVNPSIVLGPGHLDSGSSALFGEVWKGLKFYTTGTSGFVDVRDVTECMIRLIEKKVQAERYIISAENTTYRDVIIHIARGFGKPEPFFHVGKVLSEIGWRVEALRTFFSRTPSIITKETARNGQRSWNYSNEKIKRELGFEFRTVSQSVADTCRIYLEDKNNKG
jgi:nucleoside-diphosphate-sugar epimerase